MPNRSCKERAAMNGWQQRTAVYLARRLTGPRPTTDGQDDPNNTPGTVPRALPVRLIRPLNGAAVFEAFGAA
ncbi:hypothetical protein HPB50_004688 [Hyalomma asiaticum]|uniref:Uncharacterized protein n=1 Tax=Hyalomma asiaticum TaxID=266040 RepID=A0ACB7SVL0_HYAAI|nr:hypothetical protein HPB50_004688 [Hyalomma asiaticum]